LKPGEQTELDALQSGKGLKYATLLGLQAEGTLSPIGRVELDILGEGSPWHELAAYLSRALPDLGFAKRADGVASTLKLH
jgi:hypothetical protein